VVASSKHALVASVTTEWQMRNISGRKVY